MKNFKLMILCLLGLSVYGLQAMREAETVGKEDNQVKSSEVSKDEEENIARKVNLAGRENMQAGKEVESVSIMARLTKLLTGKMTISEFISSLSKNAQKSSTAAKSIVNLSKNTAVKTAAQNVVKVTDESLVILNSPRATQDQKVQAAMDIVDAQANLANTGEDASNLDKQRIADAVGKLGDATASIVESARADKAAQVNAPIVTGSGILLGEESGESVVKRPEIRSNPGVITFEPQAQETVVNNAPVSQNKSLLFSPKDLMAGGRTLRTTNRTSPTIQKFSPTPTLIDAPVEITETPKNQEVTSSNIATTSGDLFEGIAKENVTQNQQVEQPVAQEVVSQDQSVVVENPKAARIQELEAKGKKNLTLNEATELRGLKTQQTEVVTEISAIKQPGKIDTQAVDAQAMDAKTVESINNLIEKFNGDDIKLQVQSARDAYDKQYPNKTFGYKNTTAYKNGLKVVEAQAKDQALSDVKNEFATNADGSPRSNREILNALNAKYRPQSPAKPGAIGSKSAGSGLTMQQEMRVKNIIKEAKLQGETITQDKAIAQMRLEEEAKENQKPEVKVVEKAETPEEAQAKATAQAKAEAAAKLEAENNVLNEQIYQNDKASIDAQIKIQVDAAIKSDPKIRPYQIKDQIKDQIVSSKRESLSSDQKDQLLQQVADAKAAAKAEADEKAAAAKAAAKAQAEAEQEEADKRAAAIAAQAPVQDTASIEPPKMSLADQLAAAKAKKAAKAAAQAAQQAAQ